jgi:hypothetical protein
MKFRLLVVLTTLIFFSFVEPARAQLDPDLQNRLQQGALIIDRDDVDLFYQIPDFYIQRAKNITMTFNDRSVGDNINSALNCLEHVYANAPSYCRRDLTEEQYAVWMDNYYLRTNWEFFWSDANLWNSVIYDFFNTVVQQRTDRDVITFQFNYLGLFDDSHINDPFVGQVIRDYSPGFFYPANGLVNGRYDISDVEALQSDIGPDRIFFYWTSSLAKGIGTENSTIFNTAMRNYVNQHKQILFDYADIMSHMPDGTQCFDNNEDGIDYPALCDDYTNEVNGGHLNSMGMLRIAKAYWVLMAQLAGWNPGGTSLETPTPTPTLSSTPTPTMSSPTSTPQPKPGDANSDGTVDGIDYVIWLNNYDQNTSGGSSTGDFNNDGVTDGIDYVIWLNNYGN